MATSNPASFGPSADDDTDTPFDAFSQNSDDAGNVFNHSDDGGAIVDLTDGQDDEPKGKPAKRQAADEDEDGFEVEVVKEVPGNRAKDDAVLDADPEEISAEEMSSFSENVRGRIHKQTRLQRAAERRAERFRGEADEATRIIALQAQQLDRLQKLVATGEGQYVTAAKAASAAAVSSAQQKLKQAMTDGDADKIVEAQTELGRATASLTQADQYRAVAPEVERDTAAVAHRVKTFVDARQTTQNEPDPAAGRWMNRNKWFQKDPGMTNYAIQFAKGLETDGVDPIEDAAYYYGEIDKEMKRRFPDKLTQAGDDEPGARRTQQRQQQQRTQSRPVASARSSGPVVSKGKIQLTESQVRLANTLGLSLQDYAKEYVKTYGSK